ncbi:MAG: hypothetical protein J2P25_07510 [Nocardiopsaceae bacterium]|nr:hypothetical protein [Nocardiopsaceae bacterium]
MLSVQGIHAGQTGTQESGGPGVGVGLDGRLMVGATSSHSTYTSDLARRLAPPPREPGTVFILYSLAFSIVLIWLIVGVVPKPAKYALVPVAIVLSVVIAAAAIRLVVRRVQPRRFPTPGRKRRARLYAWRNAYLCFRCYGVFFDPGALPDEVLPGNLVPVENFGATVGRIGDRLAELDPVR